MMTCRKQSRVFRQSVMVALVAASVFLANPARADALYGTFSAFKAHAHSLFHFDVEAQVASLCGLRTEQWKMKVARGVQHRIDNMAAVTMPNATDGVRREALSEVSRDLTDELGLTWHSMTTNDCQTLRENPAILKRLDGLATEVAF